MELNAVSKATPVYNATQPINASEVTSQAGSGTLSNSYHEMKNKEKYERTISEEAVVKLIDKANKTLMGEPRRFEYRVHEQTGEIVVKVCNAETNEVIREIPSEKFLELIDKLQEISGMIIDEKR